MQFCIQSPCSFLQYDLVYFSELHLAFMHICPLNNAITHENYPILLTPSFFKLSRPKVSLVGLVYNIKKMFNRYYCKHQGFATIQLISGKFKGVH